MIAARNRQLGLRSVEDRAGNRAGRLMAKVREGDRAPDFELEGTGSRTYRLADYRGEGLILAFYPGDFTPVCTKQFCSYRDDSDRIQALGVPMLGISPQSVESHERFVTENGLGAAPAQRPRKASRRRLRGRWPRRLPASIDLPGGRGGDRPLPPRRPLRNSLPGRGRPRARSRAAVSPSSVRMAESLEPTPFAVDSSGIELAGERVGEGPPIVLLHGVTATRRYVVHGSNALPRRGYRQISYDARGHGESAPAPADAGYTYRELADDLGAVLESQGGERPVLCGHSMGCRTIATYALGHATRSRARS